MRDYFNDILVKYTSHLPDFWQSTKFIGIDFLSFFYLPFFIYLLHMKKKRGAHNFQLHAAILVGVFLQWLQGLVHLQYPPPWKADKEMKKNVGKNNTEKEDRRKRC